MSVPSDDRIYAENETLRERVAELEARLDSEESGEGPSADGARRAADDWATASCWSAGDAA